MQLSSSSPLGFVPERVLSVRCTHSGLHSGDDVVAHPPQVVDATSALTDAVQARGCDVSDVLVAAQVSEDGCTLCAAPWRLWIVKLHDQ